MEQFWPLRDLKSIDKMMIKIKSSYEKIKVHIFIKPIKDRIKVNALCNSKIGGIYTHFMYIYWIASRFNQSWIENDKSSCHFIEQITIQRISHLYGQLLLINSNISCYLYNIGHNIILGLCV
jgi:hypothetical protein